MKVALLTDGIYPYVLGGMQKHSYYLCKYFAQREVYVDLFHCKTWEGENPFSVFEMKFINFKIFNFPSFGNFPGHYILESYKYSELLFKALDKEKEAYDFIYAQGFTSWKILKEKKKGRKFAPIGVNFHGLNMYQIAPNIKTKLQHFLFRPPTKFILRNSDYVFSLGGKLTNIQKKHAHQQIIEIPIGIEKGWLNYSCLKQKNGVRRFTFVGRYERIKGIEELNKAIESIGARADYTVNFIGPIPEEKRLKQKNVYYHGLIKEESKIQRLLCDTDILVCPSFSEGMPTVILEAMASGCAIIATDVGAISMQVSEKNGWLIEAGQIELLKNTMLESINIKEKELMALKENSIEIIKDNFLWDKIVNKTIDVIQRLIRKN